MERLTDGLQFIILTFSCYEDLRSLRMASTHYDRMLKGDHLYWKVAADCSRHSEKGQASLRLKAPEQLYACLTSCCSSHRWYPAIQDVCIGSNGWLLTDKALALLNTICESVTRRAVALSLALKDGVLCVLPSGHILPRLEGNHMLDLKLALQILIPPPLLKVPLERAATYVVTCAINEMLVTDYPIFAGINDNTSGSIVHSAVAHYLPPGYACRPHEGTVLLAAVMEELILGCASATRVQGPGCRLVTASGIREHMKANKAIYCLLRGESFAQEVVDKWEAAISLSWSQVEPISLVNGLPMEVSSWAEDRDFVSRMSGMTRRMATPARDGLRKVVQHVQRAGTDPAPQVQYEQFIRIITCLRRSRRDLSNDVVPGGSSLDETPEFLDVVTAARLIGLQDVFSPEEIGKESSSWRVAHGGSEEAKGMAVAPEGGAIPSLSSPQHVALLCATASLEVCEQLLVYPLAVHASLQGYSAVDMAVMHGRHDVARLLLDKGARLDTGDETLGDEPFEWDNPHPPRRPFLSAVQRRDSQMLSLLVKGLVAQGQDLVLPSEALEAAILLRHEACVALLLETITYDSSTGPKLGKLRQMAGWSGSLRVVHMILSATCRVPLETFERVTAPEDLPEHVQQAMADVLRGTLYMQHFDLCLRLWFWSNADRWCDPSLFPDLQPLRQLLKQCD